MIQTPYWPGFDGAMILRDGLNAVHVNVPFYGQGADPYGPGIIAKSEEAFTKAKEKRSRL